jgi:nucleoid DNA-binding protein
MKILHQDLIREYYASIKEKYPHLTQEQVNEICSAPFKQARKGIESGDFPTIRLKYFGTFVVYNKKVEALLKTYINMFAQHRITPSNFFKKKEQLEKFLKTRNNEIT